MQTAKSSILSHFQFFSEPRIVRTVLIVGGIFFMLSGLAVNMWFKEFLFPKELYFSVGIIAVWVGILSQIFPHVKKHLYDYSFVVFVLVYLSLLFLTFTNKLSGGLAISLLVYQLLFSISFRSLAEYTIFAFASMLLFITCAILIFPPVPQTYVFISFMILVTLTGGIQIWIKLKNGKELETESSQILEDVLDNSIFAIFLVDQECTEILYQNKTAGLFSNQIFGISKISAQQLFNFLGLDITYITRMFRLAEPNLKEKSYFTHTNEEGQSIELEFYISQISTQGSSNLLLKIRDITDIKRQERRLTRSISVNESLLSAIPDILITINGEGKIQAVRASQESQEKLPLEEFRGKHFSSLSQRVMSTTKQKEVEKLLSLIKTEGKVGQMEFMTVQNHENRHLDLRLVQLKDQNETLAIIRDITDTRQVELALQQSELNYREIFNTGTDGIMILKPDNLDLVDINQVGCDMLGFSREEMHRIVIPSLCHKPSQEAFTQFLNKTVQGDNSRMECLLIKKNGSLLEAEVTAKLTTLKGSFQLMLTFVDITERVSFLRKIKAQAMLVENVSEAIISIQPDFTILSWNPAAENIYGWSAKEAIGKNLEELIPSKYVTQTRNDAHKHLFGFGFWNGETIQKHKSGRQLYIQTSATLISGTQDQQASIVVLNRNITEQKVREQQLRKSEQKFKELFNSSPEAIFVNDLDGIILDANPAACALHKSSARELIGKNITDLTPTRHREALAGAYTTMIMGQLNYLESYFLDNEKNVISVEIRASRFDLEGSPAMILHISDINQRKEAEEQLRMFRTLINQSSDAIFVLEEETGNLIDFNEQMPVSLGYTLDEMHQLRLSDLSPTSIDNSIPSYVLEEVRQLGSAIYMTRYIRKDGSTFPVEVNLGAVQVGQKSYLVGIARDITDRLHQEEALRQSEQKYRTLVEKMNEGLILTDNDETILFVNNRLCEILGRDKKELLGYRSYEVLGSNEASQTIKNKSALRLKGLSDQYELQLQHKNGDTIWVLVAGAPYIDSNGDAIGTIAIITDITDRKATELKLQEKNNELDAFVYKASHDLKGPLASIIGVTNIARDEVQVPEATRYFDLISKSTERLDNILSELLDVTRINKAQLNYEPINVPFIIDDIINSLKHLPKSQYIDFQKEIHISNGFQSDKKLLTSILQNLIVNSINYHNPQAQPPVVRVSVKEKFQNKIEFQVSDNGQGIPTRMQQKVFEMFYRGNTQSKGSGLGLYIVKNSIEKLQGSCELQSEPGSGTTFSFILPK